MTWVTEERPTKAELDACVHCGLCLPVCPTFRLTGRETASPRGRIHAMTAVGQGLAEVDETFAGIIDFCLGCRACEPVCPGMVPYARIFEGAKTEIAAQLPTEDRSRRFLVSTAPGSRSLLRTVSFGLSVGQSVGLTRLAPSRYKRLTGGLRRLSHRPGPTIGYAGGSGESGTVGLLSGCVQDEWFRPVNQAAITLLEMAGYRVESPSGQTCCGALAAHDGKAEAAHAFADSNSVVFAQYDRVVATAAGCSAHLRGYGHWGSNGASIAESACDITVVVAELIADGRLPSVPAERGPVAVHDPCHLRHGQRVMSEPRRILAAAGYEIVETDPVGLCCGAAGIYTVAQPEASARLGSQKAAQVRSTGVRLVASANPGCEMQLRSFLGDDYSVSHPIELYLAAIEQDRSGRPAAGTPMKIQTVKSSPLATIKRYSILARRWFPRPRPTVLATIKRYSILAYGGIGTMLGVGLMVLGAILIGISIPVLLGGFDLIDIEPDLETAPMLISAIVVAVSGMFCLGVASEAPLGRVCRLTGFKLWEVGIGRALAVFALGLGAVFLYRFLIGFLDGLPPPILKGAQSIRAVGVAGMVLMPLIGVPLSLVAGRLPAGSELIRRLDQPVLLVVWAFSSLVVLT